MSRPISVDLPHNLGSEEAKRRLRNGIGKIADHLPAGAEVRNDWSGDRLNLHVSLLGQNVDAHVDVEEKLVRLELALPGMLGMFAGQIETVLRRRGAELLEDKTNKKK